MSSRILLGLWDGAHIPLAANSHSKGSMAGHTDKIEYRNERPNPWEESVAKQIDISFPRLSHTSFNAVSRILRLKTGITKTRVQIHEPAPHERPWIRVC